MNSTTKTQTSTIPTLVFDVPEPELPVIPENPEESGTPDFVIIEPPPAA